ncbi:hypothetical protein MHU86_6615 [Fragilaria crotonensis]|nr:hypothetical protein MHU86_6615 [Fragilaria crotonensis]
MASFDSSNNVTLLVMTQMFLQIVLPRLAILFAWQPTTESNGVCLPRRIGIATFLLHRVYETACRSPSIWDSDSWTAQADCVMAFWLLFMLGKTHDDDANDNNTTNDNHHDTNGCSAQQHSTHVVSNTLKEMFSSYYFAAGFWKLNTHFVDPNASCATIFFVQIVANYIVTPLSWWSSSSTFMSLETATTIASIAKHIAPTATLIVELTQGLLMVMGVVLGNRTCERMGVAMALVFHFAVCMTPRPNDISGFALQCTAGLVWFASSRGVMVTAEQLRLLFVGSGGGLPEQQRWWWVSPFATVMSVVVLLVSIGMSYPSTPNNWAFFLYAMAGGFVLLSVYNEDTSSSFTKVTTSNIKRPLWSRIAVGISIFYSFGGLMTGLQEEATPNMFANLKVHGGSNHFFLPTGLLFHYYGNDDSNPSDHLVFGGGVVRVEHGTTSPWLRNMYPADMTAILQPQGLVTRLLERIGNPAPSFFNPGANRILGGIAPIKTESEPWYRYTVPALELKRLLREAKRYDRDFELTYSQLPGTRGDEVWRATAVKRFFEVVVRDGQVTKCTVTNVVHSTTTLNTGSNNHNQTTDPVPCAPTDLPMLPDNAVPYLIQKLSMHHAYPIVTDDITKLPPSIVCFGP